MKRSLSFYTGILSAFVAVAANGQTTDALRTGIAECAAQQGELTRLNCYDGLAKSAGLTVSTSTQSSADSKWIIQQETNPLDDSATVLLVNRADDGQSSWGRPLSLVIVCRSNRTSVYINWDDYLGSDVYVTSRIGNNEARRQEWSLSTDNEATFYPGDNIAFIKDIMAANSFVAQVTPYNESPVTGVWDTSGLSEAIAPLRSTCNW